MLKVEHALTLRPHPTSPFTAIHRSRVKLADTMELIRKQARELEKDATYEHIVDAYDRLTRNRKFDASYSLLGIVAALIGITASSYDPQSGEYLKRTGVGKLLEQLGHGASLLTQEEQTEIDGLIKRLEAIKTDAQERDHAAEAILRRLDELFSQTLKQIADAETQMMRNTQ